MWLLVLPCHFCDSSAHLVLPLRLQLAKSVDFAKDHGGDALAKAKAASGEVLAEAQKRGAAAAAAVSAKAAPLVAMTKSKYDAVAAKYPQFFTGANMDELDVFQTALLDGFLGTTIEAGSSNSMTVQIPKGGARLRWSFLVRDRNIAFSVKKREMADVGGSVEVEIVEAQRYESGARHTSGVECADAGTMVLCFDNGFSWMRQKHVAFKYEVVAPGQAPTLTGQPTAVDEQLAAGAAKISIEEQGGASATEKAL